MYDSGVAYADAQVGRLIDHLASRGLAGRTVLIVTSDHGEALARTTAPATPISTTTTCSFR